MKDGCVPSRKGKGGGKTCRMPITAAAADFLGVVQAADCIAGHTDNRKPRQNSVLASGAFQALAGSAGQVVFLSSGRRQGARYESRLVCRLDHWILIIYFAGLYIVTWRLSAAMMFRASNISMGRSHDAMGSRS